MRENQIQQFQNQHFGKLTVIEIDSEFFFIGKEVAELLGYKNGSRDVNRHVDEEDRCIFQNYQNGTFENIPNRGVTIINESGLYSLILLSKLPSAKAFKHWVTKEVLPSIRKHGGYIGNQENKSNEEILASAVLVAQRVIQEKEQVIEQLKPKADYYDQLVSQNLLTNLRNTAKELKIPQNKFIAFLLENKYLYRDKYERLLPYAQKNKGYFEIKEWYNFYDDLVGIQTMVTPKGREHFLILIGGDVTCD